MRNKVFLFIFILFNYSEQIVFAQGRVLNMIDYGLTEGKDATPAVMRALSACKDIKASKLIFPKGTYHFYDDFGIDKYCFISNNDEGLKRIIFPLFNIKNLCIDGQGSNFIFHGFINPFVLQDSKNVVLQNFSIDFHRSFHSEALVIAVREDGMDLEIPENFPYRIYNGLLQFTDFPKSSNVQTTLKTTEIYEYRNILEFDTNKRETAFMAKDYGFAGTALIAESLGGRKVRIFNKQLKATIGNTLTFGGMNRNYPGFVVSDCSDILFNNVTIYHCGGMGIIGQRSRNITIDHCKVTPAKGRIVSAPADATHFVNCTGQITLSNNLFENQKDDATNIHGIYVQITEHPAPNVIVVKLVHNQQFGFDFIKKGVKLELVHGASLITYDTLLVKDTQRLNKEYTRVTLNKNLPTEFKTGDAVAEILDYPRIHIHDNIIRNNRARGMLLNCRGETLVENNYFHTPGAALLFEGDARFWFEQGGVRNCIIRNNTFDNCLFGVWGKAVIDVAAGISEGFETSRYNKNITITGNTFRIFDDASLLNVYGVDGLTWKDNKISKNNEYLPARIGQDRYIVKHSDNISIDKK